MYNAENIYHVSNKEESPEGHPDWNKIKTAEARYEQFHGNVLLGLPVAGFTVAPLGSKSIFPFGDGVGRRYYRIKAPFNPMEYHIYNMNDASSAQGQQHYLCISKDDDENNNRISWLLQEEANINIFLKSYEGRHQQGERNLGEINVYFIRDKKIPVNSENWDTVEKEHYGVPRRDNPNDDSEQLITRWVGRQIRLILDEFIAAIRMLSCN